MYSLDDLADLRTNDHLVIVPCQCGAIVATFPLVHNEPTSPFLGDQCWSLASTVEQGVHHRGYDFSRFRIRDGVRSRSVG